MRQRRRRWYRLLRGDRLNGGSGRGGSRRGFSLRTVLVGTGLLRVLLPFNSARVAGRGCFSPPPPPPPPGPGNARNTSRAGSSFTG